MPSLWADEAEVEESGWQPVDYRGLGVFTFDRGQYLSALENATKEWQAMVK